MKPAKKDRCIFLERRIMTIPDDDQPCLSERITYHECTHTVVSDVCPFPDKMCAYKLENDQLVDHLIQASKKAVK